MKIIHSPATQRLFSEGISDSTFENYNHFLNKKVLMTKLKVTVNGPLYLLKSSNVYDLEQCKHQNFLASTDETALDIELRENRISILEKELATKSVNIKTALEITVLACQKIHQSLTLQIRNNSWLLWANIQCQTGDFDADTKELLALDDEKLLIDSSQWWYMSDISIAKYRKGTENFLKERVAHDWGTSLSPLQMLYVPDDFF